MSRSHNEGAPQRARLIPQGFSGGPPLECHYNPNSITLTKAASWHWTNNSNARETPVAEFTGTQAQTLTMDLLFDAYEGPPGGVIAAIHLLGRWTCPTEESRARSTPQPALLTLQWGSQTYGPCFLADLTAKYTLFDTDGEPLRATVTVKLTSVSTEPAGTNPTSGGISGRRSAVLRAGETLPSLSYREYGDANLWRAIAEANGIDDPGRVPVGTCLLVPPMSAATRLAGAQAGRA